MRQNFPGLIQDCRPLTFKITANVRIFCFLGSCLPFIRRAIRQAPRVAIWLKERLYAENVLS